MDFPNELEFDVLKTRSKAEVIIVTLFFLSFLIGCTYSVILFMRYLDIDTENKIVGYILMLPVSYTLLHFERKYDKKVRSRVIGKFKLSSQLIDVQFESRLILKFNETKMVWVNWGLNLVNETDREYLFSGFETIKIKIIDVEGKEHDFHVNNHANSVERIIVSDFIENIKNKHQFFKIHFHEQKRFSKKEYQTTLKRHSLMQSSLRRRKGRS